MVKEYECSYLTPIGDIAGFLEVIETNFVLLFSNDNVNCIIDLLDVIAIGSITVNDSYYLQIKVPSMLVDDFYSEKSSSSSSSSASLVSSVGIMEKNILFKFSNKSELIELTKISLNLINNKNFDFRNFSISQIPYSSDEFLPNPMNPPASITDGEGTESLASLIRYGVSLNDQAAIEYNKPFILNCGLIEQISEILPFKFKFHEFKLLFTPKIHGISFQSFYRISSASRFPSLLIITESTGKKFGGFVTSPWEYPNNGKYFGNTESFVFQFNNLNEIMFYYSNNSNNLFQFCDSNRIVIGGSSSTVGGSAIVITDNWLRGVTRFCDTFHSPPLVDNPAGEFIISDVEIWSIVPENQSDLFQIHL
jgi:hypothetical protein